MPTTNCSRQNPGSTPHNNDDDYGGCVYDEYDDVEVSVEEQDDDYFVDLYYDEYDYFEYDDQIVLMRMMMVIVMVNCVFDGK